MRKIVLAVAVAATLPSLTAGDPPKQKSKEDVRRSTGGAQATNKVSDKRKTGPATTAGKLRPGNKETFKQKPGAKETFKFNQSKPAQNAGAKEPGKLEQNK